MDSRKLFRRRELLGALEKPEEMPDDEELAEEEEETEEFGDELVESGALAEPPVVKDGETPKSLVGLLDPKQFCGNQINGT